MHINADNNAKLKEDINNWIKLYKSMLLILFIDHIIIVVIGIKKPIHTGIQQIINAVKPKYLFKLKYLNPLELLVLLVNSALPLRAFSRLIIIEIVI